MHFPSQITKYDLITPRVRVSIVKINPCPPPSSQFQFTIYTQESSSNPEVAD